MSKAITTRYDAIVIGAGIGGLTTGALLAKAGKRTLVVEKSSRPGGYASPTPVQVDGHTYLFDGAARSLMGCNAGGRLGAGVIYSFLDEMGDEDRCEFVRVDPFCRVILPGLTLEMPTGEDAFVEAYRQAFGADPAKLRRLLAFCRQVYKGGVQSPGEDQWWLLLPLALRSPAMLRHMSTTLDQGLAGWFQDERLRTGLSALWGYLGTLPSQASFLIWAAMMATYVEDGSFYCRGSLQHFSNVCAGSFLHRGGELLLDQAVTRIHAENGRVEGVTLANGQRLSAPVVISSLEPGPAFHNLLGAEHLPAAYLQSLDSWKSGPRAASLFLVTDLDLRQLGLSFETMVMDGWDVKAAWEMHRLEQPTGFSLTVPTIPDPGLAPAGQHMLSLTCIIPDGLPTPLPPESAAQLAQSLLAGAERVIPGIRQHLLLPAPGYALQEYGSMNGWDCTPQHSGLNRMGLRTPLRGLLQVGQWTRPGHGVMSVVLSGRMAARLAMQIV